MDTVAPLWLWATFIGIVLVSLFIDFVVLRKQGAQDIGAWATLFMFVSCLAVLTNSAVISITTTQPLFTLQEGFLSQSSLK